MGEFRSMPMPIRIDDILQISALRLDEYTHIDKVEPVFFSRITPTVLFPEPGMPVRIMLDSDWVMLLRAVPG